MKTNATSICDGPRDGMAARKALGMFFGRQRIVTQAVAKKMQSMRDAGVKVTEIADKFEIKPSTVYANTKR
jgi:DNA invertase Pin-like site-specific DNA recombinase